MKPDQIDLAGARYSDLFRRALKFTLPWECVFAAGHDGDYDYVLAEDVDGDPGGTTKFGIDQASHPSIQVEYLNLPRAMEIYWKREWDWMRGEVVGGNDSCGSEQLAVALFDSTVNPGRIAIHWLQDILGVKADGKIGPQTVEAIYDSGTLSLVTSQLLTRREVYYRSRGAWAGAFRAGWLNRTAALRKYLISGSWSDPVRGDDGLVPPGPGEAPAVSPLATGH